MRILFVHQNFPAQFKYLAPTLASHHQVFALAINKNVPEYWQGVRVIHYLPKRNSSTEIHPWLKDFESKVIRAEGIFNAALKLKNEGFTPDLIIAHPGWGESLFLKDVWRTAKLVMYCEFFYQGQGADVHFDPEFLNTDPEYPCRLRLKNINNLLHFEQVSAGIAPTHWQASTFPEPFRSKISVIHDGINTNIAVPNPNVTLSLNTHQGTALTLSRKDEIITFVNRNLEPYRGYHIFMRSLPELLRRRPNARVLIVGKDGVSYGNPAPEGQTWKQLFFSEVAHQIDLSRVHFLGTLQYPVFLKLLQLSTVHVYLTYPFVLSWSLLEAMSCACAVVASDTQPLHEVIIPNKTGQLFNFFDVQGLVDNVCELLDQPEKRAELGNNAREFVKDNYDLQSICLPKQIAWVQNIMNAKNT